MNNETLHGFKWCKSQSIGFGWLLWCGRCFDVNRSKSRNKRYANSIDSVVYFWCWWADSYCNGWLEEERTMEASHYGDIVLFILYVYV